MNWLYALAQPFVWHPARASLVALGWLLLALTLPTTVRRPLFITAVAWSVFALLELEAWRERANIRVDLLVTWPGALSAHDRLPVLDNQADCDARGAGTWGSRLTSA